MDRRLVGLALLLAGLGVVLGARAAWPAPAWMESLDVGEAVPASLLARGPAVSRYDAANDSTLAVFECSHFSCERAVVLRGDAREAAAGDGVLLRPVAPGGTLTSRPLEPPLVASPYLVDTAYAEAFEVAPRLPGPAARVLGVALAIAGAALALGSWRGALGAGLAALILWAGLATNDGGAVILLQLAGVPLSLVAATALFALRAAKPWAALPAAYLPVLVGVLASGATAFFPTDAP